MSALPDPVASPIEVRGFADIAGRFDALLLDQFGVLHDGVHPYRDVIACLDRLHAGGKRMAVLSNSGRRAADNATLMATLGLPLARFEAVITSGEVAWEALRERDEAFHGGLGRRCLLIAAPSGVDFIDGLDLEVVDDPATADFVLAVSIGEAQADLDAFAPMLRAAAQRGLPLICTNNDIIRPAGPGRVLPAPGALAERYRALGGRAEGYGKPAVRIFEQGLRALGGVARERVLMVGDSLDHDIAGARAAGLGSVLIRGGIGSVVEDAPGHPAVPTYVMGHFRW